MKSCNRKILELFYNAKHSGRIMKPDAIGRVGENDDGLVIELTWRVINGIIEDAKFRAFGNPNAIAITSLMTDNMIGKSVEDVLHIGEDIIVDNLGEFRPEYLETFDMVCMAIEEAHTNYLKRQSRKENIDQIEYYEHQIPTYEEVEIDLAQQIQRELSTVNGESRGRGRPRKIVETTEEVTTEKRGRGRPRKVVDETQVVEVGEKRGRGRPRKIVDESEIQQVPTEKRGRGRPRKIVDETQIVEVGEKRGRGRPRKIVEVTEDVEPIEKRGRGRPRKIVEENLVEDVSTEKRGRGRPRKIVDESQIEEVGEKRGRGRPKKEIKYNFPSDLDDVINDKDLDELINGGPLNQSQSKAEIVDEIISSKEVDDDSKFDEDYDLFKSNIRNILSGKPVNNININEIEANDDIVKTKFEQLDNEDNKSTETLDNNRELYQLEVPEYSIDTEDKSNNIVEDKVEDIVVEKRGRGRPRKIVELTEDVEPAEKRGRGRPRKIVEEVETLEVGEKRGRGRPKKIVIETIEETESEKRGRGRPRRDAVSSLTRSLISAGGVPVYNNTQDIVFASKNVTTTNININVTKTTTSGDENQTISNDYSKNVNISSVEENSTISAPAKILEYDEEIDMEQTNKLNTNSKIVDDELDDDIDASHIKDEAPKGGIEDLLKALLNDE